MNDRNNNFLVLTVKANCCLGICLLWFVGCSDGNSSDRVGPYNLIAQERFYDTGEILANYTITPDSLKHGLYVEYFPNGQIHRRMQYLRDQLNGLYKSFYPSGAMASQYSYVNGVAHGPYYWYHENGQLSQEGQIVWDKTDGTVKFYHPNGLLAAQRFYVNEQLLGPSLEYFAEGNIYHFSYYDLSHQRTFSVVYEKNGKIETVTGSPVANFEASVNKFKGNFTIEFDLALPTHTRSEVKLYRCQGNKFRSCPIRFDSIHYQFREPIPDDFEGKYQVWVMLANDLDTLNYTEEVFIQNNEVMYQ